MRFLLALVVAALCTPIELPRLHHQGDEWLVRHPYLFRLDHERGHRFRSELCTHCTTDGLPFRAPPGTDKECVLCIFRLDRVFYPARWRAPGLDGVSISHIGHHVISSAISWRVCAFHPRGWPHSRERFPAALLSRWATYESERYPSFPPPINLLVGHSPGPAERSSKQFGMLRQLTEPHLSVLRTASSG